MCSPSSSFPIAIPAMATFLRRPCWAGQILLPDLGPSWPEAEKSSRHSDRVAAVTPYLQLVGPGSAPRGRSQTTLILRLADSGVCPCCRIPDFASVPFRLLARPRSPSVSCRTHGLSYSQISDQGSRGPGSAFLGASPRSQTTFSRGGPKLRQGRRQRPNTDCLMVATAASRYSETWN